MGVRVFIWVTGRGGSVRRHASDGSMGGSMDGWHVVTVVCYVCKCVYEKNGHGMDLFGISLFRWKGGFNILQKFCRSSVVCVCVFVCVCVCMRTRD